METKRFLLVTCFILSILVHHAHAGEPAERVRALLDEVISIQMDPRYQGDEFNAKRRALIKDIIGKNFDLDRMAERALGEHWKKLNPEERAEFKGIFRNLFQDSYSLMVLENLKEEKILYTDEEVRQGGATVKTVMFRPHTTISVDYELADVKGTWLIQDIKIEGVSILRNYQDSFASVIRRDSYGALIEKMRLKKKEIEEIS